MNPRRSDRSLARQRLDLSQPQRHARTASRAPRWKPFVMGYALGFSGSAILGVALLIAALLLFPPARANILLLGVDRRPDETTWATRTDTMMLTTLAPPTPYVGLLSIPRDLYVQLPSGDWNRINTAHFFAEAYAPGTGPQAAMQTAQNNFGVDVHHYARVDLMGFVRIVEAMGGIEIEVPEALFDDAYPTDDYGTTTISFAPGQQHMDGEQALAYARSRHYSSDFDRAARQQLVLQAIAAQLLRPATWPRWPKILAALAQSVETDITPVEALRFAPLLIQFSPAQWDRRVIEGALVQPFTTEGGAAVQQPVWDQINPVLMEMFGQ